MRNNKIAILLNGPISNDSRMIKITRTISSYIKVDLFCLSKNESDKNLFKDNVNIIYLPSPKGFINKIIRHSLFYNEFNYFVKAVLNQENNYEYVYACDLPMLNPAFLIKKALKSKMIYDSHELYIEGLNQFFPNYLNSTFIKRKVIDLSLFIMEYFGRRKEQQLLKNTNFFITTSFSYKNYFEKQYNKKNIQIVMNCPSLQNRQQLVDYRKKYNWKKDDFIVIYQGLMNPGRALSKLIKAINETPNNIKFIILGYGTLESNLKKLTKDLSLEYKVKFENKVGPNELIGYTMAADLGINLLENINLNKKLASTNKLFEYLHANIPVLATNTPENKFVLDKYNIGFLVNNNIKEIKEKIIEASNSDLIALKLKCNEAIKEFNWENQKKTFDFIFKK